ncbi:YdcF family protein [Aquabacterium sp. A7-Y]|uniref:ElyC/SanA/YdcF family protein n=1 Tax=Aquabacterium sp. A7-Y TaxID=1349605 RepID=UPI00223CBC72|nr:ElyC/SanA/YdcF family protein [Aquabacterium sp. A7-Y]MCW7541327.1 YdcF family protein [Aquabacterium sp. A7-Y]
MPSLPDSASGADVYRSGADHRVPQAGDVELDDWVFQAGDAVESDTLFVFGTSHHIPHFAERIQALWSGLSLRRAIVSGHRGEADRIVTAACQLGIPADVFEVERRASNTYENVLLSADLLRRCCPARQLHVLAKLHAAPRSFLTLKKRFPDWQVALHGVDYFHVDRTSWRRHDEFRRKVAEELIKIADYSERGHIARPQKHGFDASSLRAAAAGLMR